VTLSSIWRAHFILEWRLKVKKSVVVVAVSFLIINSYIVCKVSRRLIKCGINYNHSLVQRKCAPPRRPVSPRGSRRSSTLASTTLVVRAIMTWGESRGRGCSGSPSRAPCAAFPPPRSPWPTRCRPTGAPVTCPRRRRRPRHSCTGRAAPPASPSWCSPTTQAKLRCN